MLKPRYAAERVGVSEETLKNWRRRTTREKQAIGPPFVRTETGRVFYPVDELEQWIKDRTVIA